MMKPIENLLTEHEHILKMIDIIHSIVELYSKKSKLDCSDMNDVLDFLQTVADKCHHSKEEDILFQAIKAVDADMKNDLINDLLSEHIIGRNLIKSMRLSLEKYMNGDLDAATVVIENAQSYAKMLSGHIMNEDYGLFPTCEQILDNKAQEELSLKFEEIENTVIGREKLDACYGLLQKLTCKYDCITMD